MQRDFEETRPPEVCRVCRFAVHIHGRENHSDAPQLPPVGKLSRGGGAPRFHVFGHIHESRGVLEGAPGFCETTTFVNAASVNLRYSLRPTPALVFDL